MIEINCSSVLRTFFDNTKKPLRYHRDDSVVVFRYYQQTFVFSRDIIAPPLILDIIITPKITLRTPYTIIHQRAQFTVILLH